MARNKITDLRDHLFEVIELLKDKESDMTIEKAKAIAGVASVIVESAKIEADLIKSLGGNETTFIPSTFFSGEKQLPGKS